MLDIYALEQLVTEAMQTAKVPGAALAIVHQRKVIYARGFGVTSVEDGGIPVTAQTIFRIGSTSKPLTTTAVMRLVEAGQLELDTPINEIVPDLQFSVPGAINEVTLRHLLSHTAALPTAAEHYGSREAAGLREGVYKDIAGYPLVAPVGKIWSYSNPGINLAGYLAELVSGKPYSQLMQELVFDPLEMKRTTLDPTIAMTYPVAQSHTLDADGNLKVDHHYADNTMHYPSGFVMSTVLDLANFAIMHLSGGSFAGKQILSPESVAEMHKPHVRFPSFTDDGYGLTLSSFNYKGVRQVGHGGRISSFASSFEFVPETGTAVIIQANNSALWGHQENVITRFVLDGLLDLPAETPAIPMIEPDRSGWDRIVGIYAGMNAGAVEVKRDGDGLTLVWQGTPLPLQAARPDLYVAQVPGGDPMPVSFVMEGDGPAQYVNVVVASGHAVMLDHLEYDPAYMPTAATRQKFAGLYDSALGNLTIREEGDQLIARSEFFGNADVPVRLLDDARLLLPFGLLTYAPPDTLKLGAALTFTRKPSPTT
jgi:CubicO group peptidase (beta-lactamase class C family)